MRKKPVVGAVLVLLLSACGAGGSDTEDRQTHRAPAPSDSVPAGTGRPAVRSDFDGDGYGDLVFTNGTATVNGKYAAGYAAVIRGSSKGPVLDGRQVVTQDDLRLGKAGEGGGFGSRGVTADLDGDGRADLVVTGTEDSTARVLLGPFSRDGAPRRTVSLDLTPSDPAYYTARPTTAGDITGDGKDDLLVTWSHVYADEEPIPRATLVYRGTADGKPVKGPRLKDDQGKDFYGAWLRTGDVNKDGFADVVAGLACEMLGDVMTPEGGSRVTVLYGGPSGQSAKLRPTRLTERTTGLPVDGPFSSCTFGVGPSVGDIDADGYADVAFSVRTGTEPDGESSVVLLRGSARGLTVEGARSLPGGRATMLDTNGDRAAELAVAGPGEGEVRVLRGGREGVALTPALAVKEADLDLGPEISITGRAFGVVG
ncbi:VCBS repeat-containing protein [Streptomyces sp. AC555_RSS877]|uniref:FG-GAP repeat domain-containing protein n=1 Tax=Streptomyces sp. AC555_RSS877 TaxID=2823688 RepID=UPI001C259277|nr:VCBS repeat-containing protein [Streptomyces sp. AC555_RSS877]